MVICPITTADGADRQGLEDRHPLNVAAKVELERRRQQQERIERQRGRDLQGRLFAVATDEDGQCGQQTGQGQRDRQLTPLFVGADQLSPGDRAGSGQPRDAAPAKSGGGRDASGTADRRGG